jgi:hypothetical protein
MKLITNSKTLEKQFLRLLGKYSKYFWLTAWASSKSTSFDKLVRNKQRIEKIIVGIHFYQTHPDFIEIFLESKNVKYIKQPEGTFHPKIYLFYNNDNDWEILVGSANFTNAAFTVNTEISTLIKSTDLNAADILTQTLNIINTAWLESKHFDTDELNDYRKIWGNFKPKINSLSGSYGKKTSKGKKKNKPIYLVPVANMDWNAFMDKVNVDQYHSLTSRIKVLEVAKNLFKIIDSFCDLADDERKFIAGIPNTLPVDKDVDWGYFGSMKGAGIYKNRIIANDLNISKALDEIPFSGQITKKHYQRFLKHYKKTFEGNYLATATRLLAMKRPDTFVCLDSKNKSALCKDFDITQSGLDYERYWDEIIKRIYDSNWWLNPEPKNNIEKSVSGSRAAFLDSLYYVE